MEISIFSEFIQEWFPGPPAAPKIRTKKFSQASGRTQNFSQFLCRCMGRLADPLTGWQPDRLAGRRTGRQAGASVVRRSKERPRPAQSRHLAHRHRHLRSHHSRKCPDPEIQDINTEYATSSTCNRTTHQRKTKHPSTFCLAFCVEHGFYPFFLKSRSIFSDFFHFIPT